MDPVLRGLCTHGTNGAVDETGGNVHSSLASALIDCVASEEKQAVILWPPASCGKLYLMLFESNVI